MVQPPAHILEMREVVLLKHREFVYAGGSVPEINGQEHAAFLINMQQSILLSLEKRSLLTASQRERCIAMLEKQFSQIRKKERQA